MEAIINSQSRDRNLTMKLLLLIAFILLCVKARGSFYTTNISIQYVDQPEVDQIPTDKMCSACLTFYDVLKQPGMKELMYENCKKLPLSNQHFCKVFLWPIFSQRNKRAKVCKMMTFCESSPPNVPSIDLLRQNCNDVQKTCNSCLGLMAVIKDTDFEVRLKRKCKIWRFNKQQECDQFFDVIFTTVRKVAARRACVETNFCAAKGPKKDERDFAIGVSLASAKNADHHERPSDWCSSLATALESNAVAYCSNIFWKKQVSVVTTEPSCRECVKSVDLINELAKNYVSNSNYNDDSAFPVIDQQTEAIRTMINADMTNQQICLVMGFCAIEKPTSNQPQSECTTCTKLTESLNDYAQLAPRADEQYLLCLRWPEESARLECQEFVQKYAGKLVMMLFNGINQHDMCRGLDLCDDKPMMTSAPLVHEEELTAFDTLKHHHHNIERKICRLMIKAIREIIGARIINDHVIDEAAKHACRHTSPFEHLCKKLFDKIFHRIIEKIKNKEHPEDVCNHL